MKKTRRITAIMLVFLMLLTAGCGKSPQRPEETPVNPTAAPVETTAATMAATEPAPDSDAAAASLNSLRQVMVETPQLFAVAGFGYHETQDEAIPVDPFVVMHEYGYWLYQDLPFLQEIPRDRIIGEAGELYCIVPLDEDATVAVSRGYWDYENFQYIYDDLVYSSSTGEPIVLFCNNASWEPDTQVYICGPSGEVYWYPQTDNSLCVMPMPNEDGDNQFFDFSPYRERLMKMHRDMKDSEWAMPTAEMLAGTTWSWNRYLKDDREFRCQVTFGEDTLSVRWNDGIDEMDHEYEDAAWELSYDEGFAILEIDFREMAGVLRYNLLYHEVYQQLYVGMDAVQENMPLGEEPLYRYMDAVPEPVEMIGTWEKMYGEIEDEMIEVEPGSCTIEIRSAASAGLLMSYISRDFPEDDFYDELLTIDNRAMYYDCGNNTWVADVDYVGPWDTTYAITLISGDTLIKQNYFLLDGAPTVSYEYFCRVEE